jgi:hypothetical protein
MLQGSSEGTGGNFHNFKNIIPIGCMWCLNPANPGTQKMEIRMMAV